MKIHLFLATFFLANISVFANPLKKTVCSATLNSNDEINTFKKDLNPKNWNFVELTDFNSKGNNDWFERSCREKVQCDILVISGHFGGSFWGDVLPLSLSLENLENSSCDQDCSGILKKPAEVFLFGCNTLAEKNEDTRTPEEYEQALMEHGRFSREQAQQIVAFRYSAFGNTFANRMTQVFSKTPRIYGFNSISPKGRDLAPSLDGYIQSKNNYENFDILNMKLNTQTNTSLMSALARWPIQQKMGADLTGKVQPVRPYCYLGSAQIDRIDKIKYIKELLESGKALTVIPYIQQFISRIKQQGIEFTNAEEDVLNSLKNNEKLQSDFNKILTLEGDVYLRLRYDVLSLMRDLSIVSRDEFKQKVMSVLKINFTEVLSIPKKDILCSLNQKLEINPSDVSETQWTNIEWVVVLGCLKPTNDVIQGKLIDVFLTGNKDFSSRALDSLMKMAPLSAASHRKLVDFILTHKFSQMTRDSLNIAVASMSENSYKNDQVLRLVLDVMLNHKDLSYRNVAIIALAIIRPTDAASLTIMQKYVDAEEDLSLKTRVRSIMNDY